MRECNYCNNKKCKRPTKNTYPKMLDKPRGPWDRGDKPCKHYVPIVSTQKLFKVARIVETV